MTKRIVLDIETNTKHDKIHLVCTLDIDTQEALTWKNPQELKAYIQDATLIIGHNLIAFDASVLNKLWSTKIRLTQVFDTLIVSRLIDPSRENGHSLEAWGETLGALKTDYRAKWLEAKGLPDKGTPRGLEFDDPVMDVLEDYCAQDVKVTAKLYQKLVAELESKGFSEQSVELEHKVAAIIAQQVRNGFKLDVVYATTLIADLQTQVDRIYQQFQDKWPPYEVERISEKTGKTLKPLLVTFNPGSRQQIAEKLMELGWKPTQKTEKGSIIVDEAVLEKIDLPEAKLFLDYLLFQKRISQVKSWLEALGNDGRVHGKVITNGAVTGRMTHSSPNMAQIPNHGSLYGAECRACWTVDDGNVLVGCDASGLELRMLAHYMKDVDYVKTVVEGSSKDGTDVHTKNQKAAGLQTRDQAKTFIYGFLYGAGPAKIGAIVGGTAKDGQRLIASFLKATPALQKLRDLVAKYAGKGFVPGLDGRKIWVRSEHSALNSLLQGAGAIVMKQGLVILYGKLQKEKLRARFVANVHDEWQIECHPDDADAVGKAAVASIKEAGEFFNLRCPLDGEYKIGSNWSGTH
jgi:DNA polymerase I-like protein with 3'-5' exonuclease and polymerase domains